MKRQNERRPNWRSKPAKKTIPPASPLVLFSIRLNRSFGNITKAFSVIGKEISDKIFAVQSTFHYGVMARIDRHSEMRFIEPTFLRDFPTLDPSNGVIVYKSREVKPGIGAQYRDGQRNSSGVEQR